MKRWQRIAIIAAVMMLTFTPYPAYADDCGSLSDCYGTSAAIIGAAVGIGILSALLLPEVVGSAALLMSAEEVGGTAVLMGAEEEAAAAAAAAKKAAEAGAAVAAVKDAAEAAAKAASGTGSGGPPGAITGFTPHGEQQAQGRDGGHGVSDAAMDDAVKNPISSPEAQERGTFKYVGKNAVVILNSDGKIVTAWPRNSGGWRNP